MASTTAVRVWDLPTRLFHWLLAFSVIGLIVTAKVGGNAMVWHFRLGYLVGALLVFRLVWGFVGGRWSRFSSFIYGPAGFLHYIRGRGVPGGRLGHNPLGALSVFGLLAALVVQVGSGLLSDDEIAFAGPLTRFVSSSWVSQATSYHKDVGQWLVIGLVALHVAAILFYTLVKRERLIGPMLHGDKATETIAPGSRDDLLSRAGAVLVAVAAGGLLAWVAGLGA